MPSLIVTDQTGATLTLQHPPKRIISLVPSQTELLFSFGLEAEVVGITKFCIHPDTWWQTKKHIGGTKSFDFSAIDALHPDLIIGNKEENYQEGIERLKKFYPVWMSDIYHLEDALQMIRSIGALTNRDNQAEAIAAKIRNNFSQLKPQGKIKVLYLIWRKPWMAAGQNTFINDMLTRNGFINVVQATRYPELSSEEIGQLSPDYILLSSEPFPFKENHIHELGKISPASTSILVDGEMFSWYGSRLSQACEYFQELQSSLFGFQTI